MCSCSGLWPRPHGRFSSSLKRSCVFLWAAWPVRFSINWFLVDGQMEEVNEVVSGKRKIHLNRRIYWCTAPHPCNQASGLRGFKVENWVEGPQWCLPQWWWGLKPLPVFSLGLLWIKVVTTSAVAGVGPPSADWLGYLNIKLINERKTACFAPH